MFILFLGMLSPGIFAQIEESSQAKAQSIITQLENNQNPPFMTISGSMKLKDRFGTRIITLDSWSLGDDKMVMEFTSDAEYGQKILRLKDDLYLYYPDADKIIPIRGSALGDSVMGSDMSYEDLTGNKSLLDSYDVSVKTEEMIMDRDCWVLELKAKSRDVAYSAQTMWIDKQLFVTRQVHQFARSGRLLRTMKILEISTEGKYKIPTRILVEDQLKRGTSTEFTLVKFDVTTPVAANKFSLQELGK